MNPTMLQVVSFPKAHSRVLVSSGRAKVDIARLMLRTMSQTLIATSNRLSPKSQILLCSLSCYSAGTVCTTGSNDSDKEKSQMREVEWFRFPVSEVRSLHDLSNWA